MILVKEVHAVLYDENAVRAIARASEFLIHGLPPGFETVTVKPSPGRQCVGDRHGDE